MSKKRKSTRGNPRKRQRRVVVQSPDHFARAGKDVQRTAWGGPTLPEKAWDHFEKMMNYEIWLTTRDDSDGELDASDLPSWYVAADRHSVDAFEFIRHSSFLYVASELRLAPWGDLLLSHLQRASLQDDAGAAALSTTLDAAYERFHRQYREATSTFRVAGELTDPVSRLRMSLMAWAAIYETDAPIWLLGVLGRAMRRRKIDVAAFGGPQSSTAQASLVASVLDTVRGTPLELLLEEAYDADLRNALLHNDYELRVNPTIELLDHKSGKTWSGQELWQLLMGGQHLLQSTLIAIQMFKVGRPGPELANAGVLSATYSLTGGGLPTIVLTQLWCCRDLDARGDWIASSEVVIERTTEGDTLLVGDQSIVLGDPLPEDYRVQAERSGWVSLTRMSVAPTLGLGLPSFMNAEKEELERLGPVDHHLVPIRLRDKVPQVSKP